MKLERKKIRIYNPELGKLPGVKVFILFNIVIGAFVITPFLSIYSNVVTEFGVTTQDRVCFRACRTVQLHPSMSRSQPLKSK